MSAQKTSVSTSLVRMKIERETANVVNEYLILYINY